MTNIYDFDRIKERDRARDVDAYWADALGPDLSCHEWLRDMHIQEFNDECSAMLLDYLPVSMLQLKEWLTEAQEQLEEYPGEHSSLFKSRACMIVEAMLASADKYQEKCL